MLSDDIRTSLRIMSDDFDGEVGMLIESALLDMERVGVDPALLRENDASDIDHALVKNAVTCYCKAHFGYDNKEAGRFLESYERIVCDLLNSSCNIAASDEGEHDDSVGDGSGDSGQ